MLCLKFEVSVRFEVRCGQGESWRACSRDNYIYLAIESRKVVGLCSS